MSTPSSGYHTNLAAEFYVLSCLHRLGLDAMMTLGNRKGVDIVVALGAGRSLTVEVKGMAGTSGWPVDNIEFDALSDTHIIVLVCFANKIASPENAPEIYVVPGPEAAALVYTAPISKRRVIKRGMVKGSSQYLHAWHHLTRHLPSPKAAEHA